MQRMKNFVGWAVSVQTDDTMPGVFVAVCYGGELPRTHHFAAECGWLAGLLAVRHARELIAGEAGATVRRAPWNRPYQETSHFESMKRKLAEIEAQRESSSADAEPELVKEAV